MQTNNSIPLPINANTGGTKTNVGSSPPDWRAHEVRIEKALSEINGITCKFQDPREYNDPSRPNNRADCHVSLQGEGAPTIVVDAKCYSTTLPKAEIDKTIDDMQKSRSSGAIIVVSNIATVSPNLMQYAKENKVSVVEYSDNIRSVLIDTIHSIVLDAAVEPPKLRLNADNTVNQTSELVRNGDLLLRKDGQPNKKSAAVRNGSVILTPAQGKISKTSPALHESMPTLAYERAKNFLAANKDVQSSPQSTSRQDKKASDASATNNSRAQSNKASTETSAQPTPTASPSKSSTSKSVAPPTPSSSSESNRSAPVALASTATTSMPVNHSPSTPLRAMSNSTSSSSSTASPSSLSSSTPNSWNQFQHAHAGLGLSRSEMVAAYRAQNQSTYVDDTPSTPSRSTTTTTSGSSSYGRSYDDSPSYSSYSSSSSSSSSNSWNSFQHAHAGLGFSRSEMSAAYHASKK